MTTDPWYRIHEGGALERLKTLPAESVHCVVTSPPYYGLRNYGVEGAYGLEPTPEEHIDNLVAVFAEVHRVLRSDGTLWLNYGDMYAGSSGSGGANPATSSKQIRNAGAYHSGNARVTGLKPKNLIGMPWRVAFALQAAGWILRSDIIWHKPNPMPESVTDRPTRAHEYLLLFAKLPRYFYDQEAIRRDSIYPCDNRKSRARDTHKQMSVKDANRVEHGDATYATANARTVWNIPTQAYKEAHFATFPEKLVLPCILAGTSVKGVCAKCGAPIRRVVEASGGTSGTDWSAGETDALRYNSGTSSYRPNADVGHGHYKRQTTGWEATCDHHAMTEPATVLDPFAGSCTVGVVALANGRSFVGIEINPEYVQMGRKRIMGAAPLFNRPCESPASSE